MKVHTMEFKITESSPKAKSINPDMKSNAVYPFDQLEVGQSFTIKKSACNWKSLRVVVSQRNARAKGAKEFAFIMHDEIDLVEVARIA